MPTWNTFDKFKTASLNGVDTVDFDTDTLKIALITSTLAPNADTHDFWNDLSTNEVSGTNYTAGGEALTTKAVTEAAGTVTFDSDDVSWTQNAAGFSNARYAVLYKDTGTPATSPLILWLDFGADKGNTAGNLSIQMAGTGLFTLAG